MDLSVVNHDDYFAKIGDDHKFPINKFGELANYLLKKKIVEKFICDYLIIFDDDQIYSDNWINTLNNVKYPNSVTSWYGKTFNEEKNYWKSNITFRQVVKKQKVFGHRGYGSAPF